MIENSCMRGVLHGMGSDDKWPYDENKLLPQQKKLELLQPKDVASGKFRGQIKTNQKVTKIMIVYENILCILQNMRAVPL